MLNPYFTRRITVSALISLIAFPSTFSYFNMPQTALFTVMVMGVLLKYESINQILKNFINF